MGEEGLHNYAWWMDPKRRLNTCGFLDCFNWGPSVFKLNRCIQQDKNQKNSFHLARGYNIWDKATKCSPSCHKQHANTCGNKKLLEEKFPTIFWIPYVAHCIDLIHVQSRKQWISKNNDKLHVQSFMGSQFDEVIYRWKGDSSTSSPCRDFIPKR